MRPGTKGKVLPFLAGGGAIVLLGAAWLCARHSPAVAEEPVSIGKRILAAGALPWFLQWASIVAVAAAVSRAFFRGNPGPVVLGALIPFISGAVWWGANAAALRRSDPSDALLDRLEFHILRKMAEQSLWESCVYDVIGPIVCPLKLAGPWTLEGWDFLLCLLSTGLVVSFWIWAGRWTKTDLSLSLSVKRREVVQVALCVFLYFCPSVIRITLFFFEVAE